MEPIYLTIDDKIPVRKDSLRTIYANVGDDKSVWSPLLEKGFAEYHGTYEALHGGNMTTALRTLAGTPGKNLRHADFKPNKLFKELKKWDNQKAMMTCGCP